MPLVRPRRRVKKRFYVILAFLIFVLSMSISKLTQDKVYKADMPVINGQDSAEAQAGSGGTDKKTVICIDPGHGGHDIGAESAMGFYEKDVNLNIGLMTGRLLEQKGFEVVYTRTVDIALGSNQKEDLQARCDFANGKEADIFVSVHCNIDKISKKSRGFEIWCRFRGEPGEELALCLQQQLAEIGYTRDRGLKYESEGGLFVLKNTRAVAVVAELGFLSNAEDSTYIKSTEGQKKCAEALAEGVADYAASALNTD